MSLESIFKEANKRKYIIFTELHYDSGKNKTIERLLDFDKLYVEGDLESLKNPAYISLSNKFKLIALYNKGDEINVRKWAENLLSADKAGALVGTMHVVFDRLLLNSYNALFAQLSKYNLPIQLQKLGVSRKEIYTIELEPSYKVKKPLIVNKSNNKYISFLQKYGADALIFYPSSLEKNLVADNTKQILNIAKEFYHFYKRIEIKAI